MKGIFVGKQCHCLLSKKYLDCIIHLKYFLKDEVLKRELCFDALTIFFQENVLLCGEAAKI